MDSASIFVWFVCTHLVLLGLGPFAEAIPEFREMCDDTQRIHGCDYSNNLVIIVGDMCGSVHTTTSNENMKSVIETKWNEVRRQHVFKLMEEQDRVTDD